MGQIAISRGTVKEKKHGDEKMTFITICAHDSCTNFVSLCNLIPLLSLLLMVVVVTYREMYILSQHSCSCIWHLNHILLYSHTLQTPDTLWMLQTESSKEVPILLEFYYCLSSHNLQGMEGSAEVLNIDSRYHFDTDCVLYVTIAHPPDQPTDRK